MRLPVTRPAPPALLAAALALPGVAPPAAADPVPDRQAGVRWLEYRDRQPDLPRIRVSSPTAWFVAPVGDRWSVAGTLAADAVSGASPAWHAAVSSASAIDETRVGSELRVTRHDERTRIGVGIVGSDESDYRSRALSIDAALDSDDGNTTWAIAAGVARDRLEPVAGRPGAGSRRGIDVLASVTHVPTPLDVVQVAAGFARLDGDLSDPYRTLDRRPGSRTQLVAQLRWNRHVDGGRFAGTTLRTSYRYYRDDWGVRAHTLGAEWVHPLPGGWRLSPLARLHSQSAAAFYFDPIYDPVLGEPFPPGFLADPDRPRSADTRLAAFGAVTIGLRAAVALPAGWSAELRTERYRQRTAWRVFGEGSLGLPTFDATLVQVSVSRRF